MRCCCRPCRRREKRARRTQCTNQLKQLALAALNHESLQHYFPAGGWGASWTGDPNYGNDWRQPGGWIFNLLPYLESAAIHDLALGKSTSTTPTLATLQGQMAATTISALLLSQPALGRDVYRPHRPHQEPGQERLCGQRRRRLCKFQQQRNHERPGRLRFGNHRDSRKIRLERGCHRIERHLLRRQPNQDGRYLGRNQQHVPLRREVSRPQQLCHGAGPGDNENFCTGYQDDVARWTGPDPRLSANAALVVAYAPRQDKDGESPVSVGGVNTFPFFGSAHGGGFNAAMCDGSVKLISYTIDSNTHYCLGNRADARPIDGSKL